MKWREPWRESIRQAWSLPGSLRRIGRGVLLWSAVFSAIVLVHALAQQDTPRDLSGRVIGIVLFVAGMSLTLHLVWLVTPRRIDFGPRGIVVSTSDEMLRVPWRAIAAFDIPAAIKPGMLTLQLHSAERHRLVLPDGANAVEIAREVRESIAAQIA